MAAVWTLTNAAVMFMAIFGIMTYLVQQKWLLITTVAYTSFCVAGILYLYCKFSGIPYHDDQWKKKLRKVAMVFTVWTLAQYAKDISSLVVSDPEGFYKDDLQNAIFLTVSLILTSIVPYMFALESSFIDIF
jgi:hypothetical protein